MAYFVAACYIILGMWIWQARKQSLAERAEVRRRSDERAPRPLEQSVRDRLDEFFAEDLKRTEDFIRRIGHELGEEEWNGLASQSPKTWIQSDEGFEPIRTITAGGFYADRIYVRPKEAS